MKENYDRYSASRPGTVPMASRPRVLVAMILEIWCRCVAHEQPRKRAIAPGYNAQLDASTAVKICGGCVLLELNGAQVMLNTVYERV
jgi:hypothetical protein